MTSTRVRITLAALCLIAAGVITLYNVGALTPKARPRSSGVQTQQGESSQQPAAGTLPVEDI